MITCTKCKKTKREDEFHRDRKNKSGFKSVCKKCDNKRRKEYSQTLDGKYSEYNHHAKERGIDFNLTKEQFSLFWKMPCSYCNSPIQTIGIDRLDSSKGYEIDNCVSCCFVCNSMKNGHQKKFFLEHIDKICDFQKSQKATKKSWIPSWFRSIVKLYLV